MIFYLNHRCISCSRTQYLANLSNPNPWIHPAANYVYVNEEGNKRQSYFEEYLPLIAMMYLAVIDKEVPATKNLTIEGRLEQFINELALINRAHNCHKSKPKLNAKGEPLLGFSGKVLQEEYDDLEGDKPCWYSEVKPRLFQSVTGHPFFHVAYEKLIIKELMHELGRYYTSTCSSTHLIALREALTCIEDGKEIPVETSEILTGLNVTLYYGIENIAKIVAYRTGLTASDCYEVINRQFIS